MQKTQGFLRQRADNVSYWNTFRQVPKLGFQGESEKMHVEKSDGCHFKWDPVLTNRPEKVMIFEVKRTLVRSHL